MNFRNCPAQLILFCLILPILLCGCHAKSHLAFINNPELSKTLALPTSAEVHSAYRHYFSMREHLILQYAGKKPQLWGTALPGVLTKSETTEKVLYLTFDACGGKGGNGFDAKLIGYLKQHRIPATLFITNLWIKDHPKEFVELAKWPEFEIENHGLLPGRFRLTAAALIKFLEPRA